MRRSRGAALWQCQRARRLGESAHHVFTYANALDQLIKRIGTGCDSNATAVRGVLHGAMALYLTRYLNVPPARIAGERGEQLDDLPTDSEAIRAALLDAFDRQRQVDHGRASNAHFNLGVWSRALMVHSCRGIRRMRYGPSFTRERHDDIQGGPSSDTA